MQRQSDPSFLCTNRTRALPGERDGQMKSIARCSSKNSQRDFSSLWEREYIGPNGGEVPSSQFYFEVIRPMQSGCRGMGFTENIGELVVVWWNASHVDWGVIGSGLGGKKELVDLVIVHFRETGEGCCVDEGTFGATSRVGGSDESGAMATVSGDVKESVCNGERNLILPNTQSINGW